jgi:hypothetical protein
MLRAMVYENESRWFAEDGQLTRRVCEDTSLAAGECCACDDAKYKVCLCQAHIAIIMSITYSHWTQHFSNVLGSA